MHDVDDLQSRFVKVSPLIHVVEDQSSQAQYMASILREHGYRVQVFTAPAAFRTACREGDVPDAVVLDMIFPEGESTSIDLLAECNARSEPPPPVVVVCARDDIDARLAAYRSGASRYLHLPVAPATLLEAVDTLVGTMPQEPYRVLLVDDDLLLPEAHTAMLRAAGIAIRIVSQPREALKVLDAFDPELVVLDIHMRDVSGPELNAIVCERGDSLIRPILFLASEAGIDSQPRTRNLVGADVLVKPVAPEQLVAAVIMRASQARRHATVRRRLETTLYKREREQNVMQRLVSEAAADLLAAGADTLDATLERVLRRVGESLDMDRAYLFQVSKDGTRMELSHQGCESQALSHSEVPEGLPRDRFPWWWDQMKRNASVIVSDVSAWPREAEVERALFESRGVRGLCAFPISRGGRVLGFIGFERLHSARDCDAPALEPLGLVAGLIGSALVRTAGERALEQQQTFTQSVLDSVSAHIAVLNREGVIVAVNEPWRRFAMENAPDSAAAGQNTGIGTNYLDVCRPTQEGPADPGDSARRDAEQTAAGIEAVMSGRAPSFRFEYPCHSPTEERWFEMSVTPLSHAGGGVVINHVNITERKRAEQSAEVTKERLRRGQIYGNIGTWEWTIATGELFWSESVAPLFGYAQGDLETSYENFLKAIHPDDREAVTEAIHAAIEREEPYTIEHRVVWPNGRVRWLLERGAVHRDAGGRVVSMLGVVQDVDARKQAELALAERERQLLQAQTLASLGHWTTDLVTGEIFWSDEVYRIFGHEPGHFTPTMDGFYAAVHPDDWEAVKEYKRQAADGHKADIVYRVLRPDGHMRHVHALAELQTDATGKPLRLTGTVQDVTERIRFEEALIAAREEADRANQAKSEFLSNMSHELRTPMNAILGFGQILEYDAGLSEAQRDDVQQILKAGRHLMDLIDEVLDLAKVESGRIDLSLETVEVGSVVEECLSLVSNQAEQRSIQLSHQGEDGLSVQADRTRLRQALLNLLSNAIKYNREGGRVRLDVQVTEHHRTRIRVADTGHGIPSERLSELFETFNRLGAETSGIEGAGIGLTLTRRIIELMGGTVEVESEVGVGSTFWIELPQGEPRDSGCEPETSRPAVVATDSAIEAPLKVLCIEDNPANIKLMEQILSRVAHVHLITAHTPELGLELARSRRPALILLDINLPGMDGYSVLETLRAEAGLKDTPVIAITARAMPRDIERGRAAGFSDYLTKPLDVGQFLDVMKRCLAGDTS
ncbi:MAG: response regulator [Chromatiaceae bacterium]|nr:MAG: response regulator [Chromatiaceae bacterium]